jgi:hypothetical protein
MEMSNTTVPMCLAAFDLPGSVHKSKEIEAGAHGYVHLVRPNLPWERFPGSGVYIDAEIPEPVSNLCLIAVNADDGVLVLDFGFDRAPFRL